MKVYRVNCLLGIVVDGNSFNLHFMQKFASRPYRYPAGQKFRQNPSISDKCAFARYEEIQDGRQKWRESNFCEKSPVAYADTLRVKNFVEISLSRTVSKINALLCFIQKFKMAAKNGRKAIFLKCCQYTLQMACGSKLSSKLLYLALFPR